MSDDFQPWVEEIGEGLDPLLSVKEAAEILGIPRSSMYRVIKQNPELTVQPLGERYKVVRDKLLEFLAKGGVRENSEGKVA